MKLTEVVLTPEEAFRDDVFPTILYRKLGVPDDGSVYLRPHKRSIDARGRRVVVRVQVETLAGSSSIDTRHADYPFVGSAPSVLIVGSGPAGMFAGLRLIELGIKPVILERGKDVQSRRHDLAAINKKHIVDPDSNYCFGEGGAGTYSDGKLYTRSDKRGDVKRILEIMVSHGARSEILFDAHPHIGTNKLPRLISAIRQTILNAGGEIHFGTRVVDLLLREGRAEGVKVASGAEIFGEGVILATGHSARDIYDMLNRRSIRLDAKPFALGVRVEHPQDLIDRIQYHCTGKRDEYLPASSYSLVHQVNQNGMERGVFSFCMCPGGFIVPAATSPGEVVVNGMSPSRRDSRYANSGIVVAVGDSDFMAFGAHGPLAGLRFQAEAERRACDMAGGSQKAPAQRLVDFVEGKTSSMLPSCSYQPGLTSIDLRSVLPESVHHALRQGFQAFGKKMKSYLTNEAVVVGVESRTSSPVRIPRIPATLEHPGVHRLFPCGEGAGYAGGIVSAAMDGERCAEAVARMVSKRMIKNE